MLAYIELGIEVRLRRRHCNKRTLDVSGPKQQMADSRDRAEVTGVEGALETGDEATDEDRDAEPMPLPRCC